MEYQSFSSDSGYGFARLPNLLDQSEQQDNFELLDYCDSFLDFSYQNRAQGLTLEFRVFPQEQKGESQEYKGASQEQKGLPFTDQGANKQTNSKEQIISQIISSVSHVRTAQQIILNTDDLLLKRKVEQGTRSQTKNICRHLHTETAKFLKNMYQLSQLSREEAQIAKIFSESKVCIQNFHNLFKIERLASLCRDYYQSKTFLTEILRSKMDMKTKKTLIKYLNRFQRLTLEKDFKSWKKLAK